MLCFCFAILWWEVSRNKLICLDETTFQQISLIPFGLRCWKFFSEKILRVKWRRKVVKGLWICSRKLWNSVINTKQHTKCSCYAELIAKCHNFHKHSRSSLTNRMDWHIPILKSNRNQLKFKRRSSWDVEIEK